MITLTTGGFGDVLADLEAGLAMVPAELQRINASVLEDARDIASQYPPELPGQVYLRTGDLGDAWQTAVPLTSGRGTAQTLRLRNLTPYSGVVQDEDDQASIHRRRWDTTAEIVRQLEPLAQAEVERSATRIARRMEGR